MDYNQKLKYFHEYLQDLIRKSKDPYFTQFLRQLGGALWDEKITLEQAEADLQKNLETYQLNLKNMNNKKSMEFTVGAGVLGIIGAFFILIAFVTFAMNFMSGIVKGLSLYGIAVCVLLISEFLVKKRQPTFSMGMTGVGICGLYIATIVNYIYFHNFNGIIAIIITAIITGCCLYVSRKKDSQIIRLITVLGSIISLFPVSRFQNESEFLFFAAIIVIVNVAAIFITINTKNIVVDIVHMFSLVILAIYIVNRAFEYQIIIDCISIFLIFILILLNLIFQKIESKASVIASYCISYGVITLVMTIIARGTYHYISFAIMFTIITFVFTLFNKNDKTKFIPYWFWNLGIILRYGFNLNSYDSVICIIILFIFAKGLSFLRIEMLKYSEATITGVALYYLLFLPATNEVFKAGGSLSILAIAGAFLISIVALRYWKTFYEFTITIALVLTTIKLLTQPDYIYFPVCTGILFFGIIIFNKIRKWKDSHIKIYNRLCMITMLGFYAGLTLVENKWIHIIMLLFGIATILNTFDEEYGLNANNKFFALGIFLTYMSLVFRTSDMITSILLLLVALLSVILGFVLKQKRVRLYGLGLAIFVSIKITLFDFRTTEPIQKVTIFLIVGVAILLISYLYMRLEKRISREE